MKLAQDGKLVSFQNTQSKQVSQFELSVVPLFWRHTQST